MNSWNTIKKILTVYYRSGFVELKKWAGFDVELEKQIPINEIDNNDLISLGIGPFDAVICPGGLLKPLKRGVYLINEKAFYDAEKETFGKHVYNRLMLLAYRLAKLNGTNAYMIDPLSCDELFRRNRISSNSAVAKESHYHAFEHEAALFRMEKIKSINAEDRNYIVVYADDITDVGAHMRGFCVDVNDAFGLEGPMGLISSGDVQSTHLYSYIENEDVDIDELSRTLSERSGLLSYVGKNSVEQLDVECSEDEMVAVKAYAYQIAKWIGSSAAVLKGQVDGIVLCGKAVKSSLIVREIKKRVENIAEITVIEDLDVHEFMMRLSSVIGTFAWPIQQY